MRWKSNRDITRSISFGKIIFYKKLVVFTPRLVGMSKRIPYIHTEHKMSIRYFLTENILYNNFGFVTVIQRLAATKATLNQSANALK